MGVSGRSLRSHGRHVHRGMHTQLLKLSHSLVVLPVKLRPLGEVVLRRRVAQLALQANNVLFENLTSLRRAGCRSR
jgi:hypothetical protein